LQVVYRASIFALASKEANKSLLESFYVDSHIRENDNLEASNTSIGDI